MVRYTGRFDFTDEGATFAWSGCALSTSFEGPSIGVRLRPVGPVTNNWINVVVDGSVQTAVHIDTDKTYLLAAGLSGGKHTVELVKRTEAQEGELQFFGFELPAGGGLFAAPEPPSRRIEFIGDSITCGFGNEASCAEDEYKPAEENFCIGYAALTTKALDAECVVTAWSGRGAYQNYGGDHDLPTMPAMYPRTLPQRVDSMWDFGSWIADVVVINLGTNDFSVDVDTDAFKQAYEGLVREVRAHYANAHIVCTIMSNQKAVPFITEVVERLSSDGDVRVVDFFYTPDDIEVNGIGACWHPSARTHAVMARELTEKIRQITGW